MRIGVAVGVKSMAVNILVERSLIIPPGDKIKLCLRRRS
jgi:hypothetical protein